MGKRKKSAQRRMIRENDAFDMIERGEEPKNVKNEPKTIYSGKKLKKKLKARGGSILIKHYLQLTVKMCQICGTQTKPILAEGPTDVYY